MSEQQSIRDELANLIPLGFTDRDPARNVFEAADRILASPVIRRIQAEVLRVAADLMLDADDGLPFDDDHDRAIPSAWLIENADRIEKGD